MPKRAFLLSLFILIPLVIISSPPLLEPFLPQATKSPTATILISTVTPTASATSDPFAFAPTATAFGYETGRVFVAPTLPALGTLPPVVNTSTSTPAAALITPSATPTNRRTTTLSASAPKGETDIPVPPEPNGDLPERLLIPALGLDVPVEPVGMIPSSVAEGVFEWDVPTGRIAGWLNTSAPPGRVGNTVLDGHHNIEGEVFRGLWELAPGDEITLSGTGHTWRYRVDDVLILPERDQPLETRLQNASYIQPTEDERLTLITCWPYSGNTHRVVVIALPK